MRWGVYKKIKSSGKGKGTGVGELYQFIGISRNHYDGKESVIYIPLRIEKDWAGTVRLCDIPIEDFETMFEFVDKGLPK